MLGRFGGGRTDPGSRHPYEQGTFMLDCLLLGGYHMSCEDKVAESAWRELRLTDLAPCVPPLLVPSVGDGDV